MIKGLDQDVYVSSPHVEGQSFNVNIPLNSLGTSDSDYLTHGSVYRIAQFSGVVVCRQIQI